MSQTLLQSIRGEVREFFLLEEAARRTSKFSEAQRASVRAYYHAGKRRLFAASALREPADAPAGILLYREAWLCLSRAFLLSSDEHLDVARLAPDAVWERLDRAIEERKLVAPADVDAAKDTLIAPDPIAVDRLSPDEVAHSVDALDGATRWLSRLVEARSLVQLKWTRIARQAAAAALTVLVFVALGLKWVSPKDVALDKPVQSTPAGYETTASGAVDGEKNGRFGFHSQEADSPWLSIDLEKVFALTKVKVFGRGECCFDQSIPLTLEVSEDGVSFQRVGERTDAFSEADPWIVTAASIPARFVRLRVERHGVLVLSEVEVYGKAKK